ncbi:hypothetical protein KIL84_017355 [Mauremys mutica]|uniref:Uncharacterized protein n=1 Tax=Mauremys mutica TaxID=74926 RepID=A0A9D3X5Z2_9SAUR|nr:hypothetical protein KIL84_017355 [Mauremys mutica]
MALKWDSGEAGSLIALQSPAGMTSHHLNLVSSPSANKGLKVSLALAYFQCELLGVETITTVPSTGAVSVCAINSTARAKGLYAFTPPSPRRKGKRGFQAAHTVEAC